MQPVPHRRHRHPGAFERDRTGRVGGGDRRPADRIDRRDVRRKSPARRPRQPVLAALFQPCGQSGPGRSEEHTSELQSLMRTLYDAFCLKKKTIKHNIDTLTRSVDRQLITDTYTTYATDNK